MKICIILSFVLTFTFVLAGLKKNRIEGTNNIPRNAHNYSQLSFITSENEEKTTKLEFNNDVKEDSLKIILKDNQKDIRHIDDIRYIENQQRGDYRCFLKTNSHPEIQVDGIKEKQCDKLEEKKHLSENYIQASLKCIGKRNIQTYDIENGCESESLSNRFKAWKFPMIYTLGPILIMTTLAAAISCPFFVAIQNSKNSFQCESYQANYAESITLPPCQLAFNYLKAGFKMTTGILDLDCKDVMKIIKDIESPDICVSPKNEIYLQKDITAFNQICDQLLLIHGFFIVLCACTWTTIPAAAAFILIFKLITILKYFILKHYKTL